MRVRTEDKRREIVEIAARTFQELGYDRASMSLISQKVGGSKATLYGYFKSKEELLMACLYADINEQSDQLMDTMLRAPNFREGLIQLGTAYISRRLASRPISNMRIMAAQPEELGIGEEFYANILKPAWQTFADRLARLMEVGILRRADPWTVAMQWKGLLETDMLDRRLIGAIREGDPKEMHAAAVAAADILLQVYGAKGAGDIHVPDAIAGAEEKAARAAKKAAKKAAA
ncbi:MAG TPA: TetR/AcrR family transcriptional regulator [Allosphingosinicella sp.]|nr:TetR/AcrR family transcriptional regulator [Allosphingosinicella sp.]